MRLIDAMVVWVSFFAAGLCVAAWLKSGYRRRKIDRERRRRRRCVDCNYPLVGRAGEIRRCPECGSADPIGCDIPESTMGIRIGATLVVGMAIYAVVMVMMIWSKS